MATPIRAALLMYGLATAIAFGVALLIKALSFAMRLLDRRHRDPAAGPQMP